LLSAPAKVGPYVVAGVNRPNPPKPAA